MRLRIAVLIRGDLGNIPDVLLKVHKARIGNVYHDRECRGTPQLADRIPNIA
jgi:hypothetical protein